MGFYGLHLYRFCGLLHLRETMKTLAELNMTPLVAVVDIETASRKPNAAILSVGCVIVNVLEQVEVGRFYSRCDMDDQIARDQDNETLDWWEKVKADNPESYEEAFSLDLERSPLAMVLTGLDAFFACHFGEAKRQVMGNGPEFDNVILGDACKQLGIEQPWHYGGNQSLRTAVLMGRLLLGIDPKYDLPKNPHPHHALYDAIHEADYLMAVFAAFQSVADDAEDRVRADLSKALGKPEHDDTDLIDLIVEVQMMRETMIKAQAGEALA